MRLLLVLNCVSCLTSLGQADVVAEAASVREAIEKLKEYPIDVIFLDINMPEATGLKLAEALRTLKFPPNVVFVTAYSEYALEAFKVNAVDYLVKPVETERLAQALARVRENVALHMQAQKSERISIPGIPSMILLRILPCGTSRRSRAIGRSRMFSGTDTSLFPDTRTGRILSFLPFLI